MSVFDHLSYNIMLMFTTTIVDPRQCSIREDLYTRFSFVVPTSDIFYTIISHVCCK